jgi:homoserine kinase type II
MAVYTDLTDEELAGLVAQYDLGVPQAFKGIAEGVTNSNFLLETDQARFILTIYERRFVPAELPFFMDVMERLADRAFPAPRPIHTRSGATIASVRGKPCAIVSFLNGISPRKPTVAQCRVAGEALGWMHKALEGFTGTRANGLGPQAWAGLVTPHLDVAEGLRPGLAASAAADLADLAGQWPRDLPRGVIHADLFPDNILLMGDALGGVIDFYFACVDFLAYDLAVCLNAWCFEPRGAFNHTKGRAMIAGYESVRALNEAERAALPLLARGAAMRFFSTRLHDWTENLDNALVQRKDPLDYADRLDFHRKAKGAEDYGA